MPLQVRTDPPKPEDVRASYGFVALIAEKIPEIGQLMERAVREQWTPDRFSLALANTNWWKTTPDASRQWLVRNIADPASAEADIQTGTAQLLQELGTLGLGYFQGQPGKQTDQDRLRELYITARVRGVLDDDVARRQFLVNEVLNQQPRDQEWYESRGGRYGEIVNNMLKLAVDYGYNSPNVNREIVDWANIIMRGGGAEDTTGWQRKLQNFARTKYAAFADRIDAGETVMDIAQPYLQSYANVLELNQQDIALSDQLVQKALQGTGQAALPVWQFEQELRKDERYGYTNGARKEAASAIQTIGRAFGMVG